jgi:hypothetical protein
MQGRDAVVPVTLTRIARIGRSVPAAIPENKTASPFDMTAVRLPAAPTQIALHITDMLTESLNVIGAANE